MREVNGPIPAMKNPLLALAAIASAVTAHADPQLTS